MGFNKRTIEDRVATGDNKFSNSGTASALVLTPTPDSVTKAGTPVNAELLQRYENGLYAVGNNLDGGKASGNDANNNHSAGVMGSKITMRSDTASNWSSSNPVLAKGEYGFDTTNKAVKVGDGSTSWNNLDYVGVTYHHFVYFRGIMNYTTSGMRTIFLVFVEKSNQPLSTVQDIISWLYSKGYTSNQNAMGCLFVVQNGALLENKIYTDGTKIYNKDGYYFTSYYDNDTFDCVTTNI